MHLSRPTLTALAAVALIATFACATEGDTDRDDEPNEFSQELCYEHSCNDSSTGERCFSSQEAYCSSLCAENNCAAEFACNAECASTDRNDDTGDRDTGDKDTGDRDTGDRDTGDRDTGDRDTGDDPGPSCKGDAEPCFDASECCDGRSCGDPYLAWGTDLCYTE